MPKKRDAKQLIEILKKVSILPPPFKVIDLFLMLDTPAKYRTFIRNIHHLSQAGDFELVKKGGGRGKPVNLIITSSDLSKIETQLRELIRSQDAI